MDRWNVKEFVVAQMVDEFGYELIVDEEITDFRRVVDNQQASVFMATMKPGSVSLNFGMARRDINDLRDHLRGHGSEGLQGACWDPVFYAAIDPRFHDVARPSWLSPRETESDVADWLRLWVPKLEAATTLSSIQKGLELVNARANEHRQGLQRKHMLIPRMLNRMLWGWRGDRDYEEFIRPRLEMVEQLTPDTEYRKATVAFTERSLAWIAKHPNGIDRELIGDATADFDR